MKQQNPSGNEGLGTANVLIDEKTVSRPKNKINVYQYVGELESSLLRWAFLAAVQCIALLYFAVIGGKP